jgi:hypothetical protein
VRHDAVISRLVNLSKAGSAGAPSSHVQQLHTVLAAVESGAGAELSAAMVSQWPGGRHANDHSDFPMVSVEPIAEEVVEGAPDPFLPDATGADGFLAGQVRCALAIATSKSHATVAWTMVASVTAASCRCCLQAFAMLRTARGKVELL